jgi:hypothetical protein
MTYVKGRHPAQGNSWGGNLGWGNRVAADRNDFEEGREVLLGDAAPCAYCL